MKRAILLPLAALILAVSSAAFGADGSYDNLIVITNIVQTDPGSTNVFLGKVGLNMNPDVWLALGGFAANEDILSAYKSGTNEFAIQMVLADEDRLKFYVATQHVMTVCRNGKVGIGVSDAKMLTQDAKLEVDGGDVRLSSSQPVVFSDQPTGDENWSLGVDGENLVIQEKEHTDQAFVIEDSGSGFNFYLKGQTDSNSTWMAVLDSGNVAFGQTNVTVITNKLYVAGDARLEGELKIKDIPDYGDLSMGGYNNAN